MVQPMAWPTGCSYGVYNMWMTAANCTSHNGGSWQAIAVCKSPSTGKVTHQYSRWAQSTVYAYCHGDSKAISAGINQSAVNKS